MSNNTIFYQIYWKGKKIDSFIKNVNWPFIWGEKGCRIVRIAKRRKRVFEVLSVKTIYTERPQIRVYVKEVKMPKLNAEKLFELCRNKKAVIDIDRINHKEIVYLNWRYYMGWSSPNRGYPGGWMVYKEKIN